MLTALRAFVLRLVRCPEKDPEMRQVMESLITWEHQPSTSYKLVLEHALRRRQEADRLWAEGDRKIDWLFAMTVALLGFELTHPTAIESFWYWVLMTPAFGSFLVQLLLRGPGYQPGFGDLSTFTKVVELVHGNPAISRADVEEHCNFRAAKVIESVTIRWEAYQKRKMAILRVAWVLYVLFVIAFVVARLVSSLPH